METKIKQALVYIYTLQGGSNWQQLGRAISWRIRVSRVLAASVRCGKLHVDDFSAAVAGLSIQRQIEDELDQYQAGLQELARQLQAEQIDEDELTERLEAITAAILLIALLRGSGNDSEEARAILAAAVQVLNTIGADGAVVDVIMDDEAISAAIPDEAARAELNSELAIASVAGAGLAADLLAGTYEDKEDALFSRLAMWVTTALGVYAVGQLLRAGVYWRWVFSPLKSHCGDCDRLNNQVHTSAEWSASGWRTQSRALACQGFKCGCIMIAAEGPSQGNF